MWDVFNEPQGAIQSPTDRMDNLVVNVLGNIREKSRKRDYDMQTTHSRFEPQQPLGGEADVRTTAAPNHLKSRKHGVLSMYSDTKQRMKQHAREYDFMPFLQAARRNPSRSALPDDKAKKRGRRATVFSVTGDEYTGEWLDNKKHGRGTQVWKKSGSIYNGEWKMGKRDGFGTYSVLVPDTKTYAKKYCGEWKNGMKHGHGTFLYHRCSVYEGQWSEDQRSGWGRMLFNGGDTYEGDWTKDKEHGLGIRRYANGNWYEGSWRDGKKNGKGKLYYCDRGHLYEGLWVRGEPKCGTLEDFGGDHAAQPAKCPIPQVKLADMEMVLQEAHLAHLNC
ncbi:MORN repeat-containing protein 3 [Phycodurus eques]|uniref:MORN repeat-containing protein 3 n=1 Tax=Phycodurus eques TaxID=693459 RepID=UPI002ACD78F0|nr:MORN repeat-containing protein 3 [Phycodurus eques]